MNTETTSIECATGLVRHPTFAEACRFWLKLGFINLGEHVVLPNTGSVNRIGGIVAAAAFAGMVKWNLAPFPGSGSTHMRPPCRSTIFLQMAKPMPVPGYSSRPCRRWKMMKMRSKY